MKNRPLNFTVRLSPAERQRLDALAQREGLTRSDILRVAVRRALAEAETGIRPLSPSGGLPA